MTELSPSVNRDALEEMSDAKLWDFLNYHQGEAMTPKGATDAGYKIALAKSAITVVEDILNKRHEQSKAQ